jgi:hypothetical protein
LFESAFLVLCRMSGDTAMAVVKAIHDTLNYFCDNNSYSVSLVINPRKIARATA